MKINLSELIADREAGHTGEISDGNVFYVKGVAVGYHSSEGMEVAANSNRLRRLPDLEAAYIEAVELIRDMNGHGWPSVDLYDRARKFLGDGE